jgi:hypothetical protein
MRIEAHDELTVNYDTPGSVSDWTPVAHGLAGLADRAQRGHQGAILSREIGRVILNDAGVVVSHRTPPAARWSRW